MKRPYTVGIDLHKHSFTYVMLDPRGQISRREKVAIHAESVERFLQRLPQKSETTLEATSSWGWLADALQDRGHRVHLAHPLKVKVIAECRAKTDKVDAEALARLTAVGWLPEAYLAPAAVRQYRRLLRHRAALVSQRTQVKNRVRALLAQYPFVEVDLSRAFSQKSRRALRQIQLPQGDQRCLDSLLDTMAALDERIQEAEGWIEEQMPENAQADRIRQIPGIGLILAHTILSEIGDIQRFKSAKALCSFAGLVPTVRASAEHVFYGRLTKQGSRWLRWALIEAAVHAAGKVPQWKNSAESLRTRKGAKAARVEIARKIAKAIYHMLKENRDFDTQQPGSACR